MAYNSPIVYLQRVYISRIYQLGEGFFLLPRYRIGTFEEDHFQPIFSTYSLLVLSSTLRSSIQGGHGGEDYRVELRHVAHVFLFGLEAESGRLRNTYITLQSITVWCLQTVRITDAFGGLIHLIDS